MVACPRNGLLFNNKEERTIDTYNTMDESPNNYPEWKKPEK